MSNNSFSKYSAKHVHFLDESEEIPVLVKGGLSLACRLNSKPIIADLGCGDGRLIFALYANGFLQKTGDVIGIDLSEDRIKRLTKMLPSIRGIASDALNVKDLQDSAVDFLICSQVIEHVNDKMLLNEIKRLLSDGGLAYISTVAKKWYGIYFYFNNGSFRLDPTHVKEYSSAKEFASLISKEGFDLITVKSESTTFPLTDIIVRFFIRLGLLRPNVAFYSPHKFLTKFRKLRIPIIGYETCEVFVKKK